MPETRKPHDASRPPWPRNPRPSGRPHARERSTTRLPRRNASRALLTLLALSALAPLAGCAEPAPEPAAPETPPTPPRAPIALRPHPGGPGDCPPHASEPTSYPFHAYGDARFTGHAPGLHEDETHEENGTGPAYVWVWQSASESQAADHLSRIQEFRLFRKERGEYALCGRVDLTAPDPPLATGRKATLKVVVAPLEPLPPGNYTIVVDWTLGCRCPTLERGNTTAWFTRT